MSQPPHGVPPGRPWSPPPGRPHPQVVGFLPPQPPPGKPVYQRPWFAFLALFLVIGTIGAALDRDDDPAPAAATATSSPPPSSSVPPPPVAPTSTVPPAPVAPTAALPSVPPTTVPPATVPPPSPAPTKQAAPVVDFAMPSVVGMDLQSAQDLIQTNGVFLSLSHDLLGTRNQVLDANWRVCTQNVAAGQRVTGDVEGAIDLGVVKLEELCP